MNKKKSSVGLASKAAKILTDKNTSTIQRSLAGSVLSQCDDIKQTGGDMEGKASRVLLSDKYSDTTKSLAASIVSQSNKKRH